MHKRYNDYGNTLVINTLKQLQRQKALITARSKCNINVTIHLLEKRVNSIACRLKNFVVV